MEEKKPKFFEGERVVGEIVTIYAAIACTYEESHVASYHLTRHEAVLGASGLGYSGPDGDVRPILAIRLSDGRYALSPELIEITIDSAAEAKLRETALKKLTPAERAALMGRLNK
jgi:hypothetical protein